MLLTIENKGYFTDIVSRLYTDIEQKPLPLSLSPLPRRFNLLVRCLYSGSCLPRVSFSDDLPEIPDVENPDDILIGFSGGKDSTAVAVKALQLGLKPTLGFVKGLNRAYPDELTRAQQTAEKLNLPFVVFETHLKGKRAWVENPIKNQLILALLVDHGLKFNICQHAQGNLYRDSNKAIDLDMGLSDTIEMYDVAAAVYGSYIKNFKLFSTMLKNGTDSFLTIFNYNPNLFEHLSSCMMPYMYKKSMRERITKKFNVELLDGRCGCCYKCADEFLHFTLFGLVPFNEPYIIYLQKYLKKDVSSYKDDKRHLKGKELLYHFVDKNRIDPTPLEALF